MIPRLSRRNPSTTRGLIARRTLVSKSRALVTKAQVKQMIISMLSSSERKFFDFVSNSQQNIDDTGLTPVSISSIPQGSSDTTRVGDSLTPTKLEYHLTMKYNNVSTITNLATSLNVVRLIIFRWKPFFSDVAPTVLKVMHYNVTSYAAMGPLVHDGRDQFEVLVDRRFVTDGLTNAYKIVNGEVKLNGNIQYKAGSTTNQSLGLYFLLISDAATGGGVYPSVQSMSTRIEFTDS